MFDLSQQSVSLSDLQRRGKVQAHMLDCYRNAYLRPMDSWEPGRVAILLPLRHHPSPMGVFVVSGQRPREDIDNRSFSFCYFGSNQCDSYLAISLDE